VLFRSPQGFWKGTYFKQLEEYYADHFPARDRWVDASSRFRHAIGFETTEIKTYDVPPPGGAEIPPPDSPSVQVVIQDSLRPDNGETGQMKNGVFVFRNRGYSRFGGGTETGRKYAEVVNGFTRMGIPNFKVYNMVIPVALEFEITEKYRNMQKPNRPAIENIYRHLDSSVTGIWAIDEMRKHRDEYIYFNTDHHWTSLGAYYAYRPFCQAAGFSPVMLDTIPSRVKKSFLGTLYRLTLDANLRSNPDSVRYYLFPVSVRFQIGTKAQPIRWTRLNLYAESASGGNSYGVFIYGDQPVVKMETPISNGRRICVIKESFGNAFVPFLVNHYEKVIVVDQRHFTGDFAALLRDEGIGELLVLNNIFAAHTPFHINKIKGLQPK
jgi:hypothetical protein